MKYWNGMLVLCNRFLVLAYRGYAGKRGHKIVIIISFNSGNKAHKHKTGITHKNIRHKTETHKNRYISTGMYTKNKTEKTNLMQRQVA